MIPVLMIATKNPGKRIEMAELIRGAAADVRMLDDKAPAVEETGSTFYENALIKARSAYAVYRCPVIADDSGLTVDALGGEPGVHSARYGGPGMTDADRTAKLLDAMRTFGHAQRSAQFRCTIVLMTDEASHAVFDGVVHGRIIDAPRGAAGFGYDPVFVPNGYTTTFAEMDGDAKNYLSHRGMAVRKCRRLLRSLRG